MPATFVTTVRNKLRAITGTSLVSDIDEGMKALADDVDTKMASWSEGTFAARPAAGQANRFYKATDTGAIYHDTGTVWEQLIRAADTAYVGDAQLVANRALINTATAYAAGKLFTKAEAEAGVEPSATRPALVSWINLENTTIGGVALSAPQSGAQYYVPPGVKWKATIATTAQTVLL